MIFKGSCTAQTVEAWISRFLLKELKNPTIVIMDNASFHNKKRLKEILEKEGHYLLPLPPYSPDLNPIENTFGGMKKRRKGLHKNTTIDELVMSYF